MKIYSGVLQDRAALATRTSTIEEGRHAQGFLI
jgi:hypothetical protein